MTQVKVGGGGIESGLDEIRLSVFEIVFKAFGQLFFVDQLRTAAHNIG